MAFVSELDLLRSFLRVDHTMTFLPKKSEVIYQEVEPMQLFGIPDFVLAANKRNRPTSDDFLTIAFELKLKNWQRALVQAFRYRAFCHQSFVVLDESYSASALRQVEKFIRSNIGLATIDDFGQITIHFTPTSMKPYCGHLEAQLCQRIIEKTSDANSLTAHRLNPLQPECKALISA
jgi:hypothetical protein